MTLDMCWMRDESVTHKSPLQALQAGHFAARHFSLYREARLPHRVHYFCMTSYSTNTVWCPASLRYKRGSLDSTSAPCLVLGAAKYGLFVSTSRLIVTLVILNLVCVLTVFAC
jgi:hypothetical protein